MKVDTYLRALVFATAHAYSTPVENIEKIRRLFRQQSRFYARILRIDERKNTRIRHLQIELEHLQEGLSELKDRIEIYEAWKES